MKLFDKESWNEIFQTLKMNPIRTALTVFGVWWGVFILVALLALTKGLENGTKVDFGNMATNSMFIWTQQTSMAYEGHAKVRKVNFRLDNVEKLKAKIPELKYVSPRNQLGGHNAARRQD